MIFKVGLFLFLLLAFVFAVALMKLAITMA